MKYLELLKITCYVIFFGLSIPIGVFAVYCPLIAIATLLFTFLVWFPICIILSEIIYRKKNPNWEYQFWLTHR